MTPQMTTTVMIGEMITVTKTLDADTLSVEIPVGEDRKVTIRYPRDLSTDEAKKVGNVLSAIVG